MAVLIMVWVVCAVLCAAVASGKGHGGCLWGLMGLIFGVFALLIILVLPANRPPAPVMVTVKNDSPAPPAPPPRLEAKRPEKICPDCAETILADAKVCRHCGYRFDGAGGVRAIPAAVATPPYQREHLAAVTVLKATAAAAEPVGPAHVTIISDYVVHREGWRDTPASQMAELRRWVGSVAIDAAALRAALGQLRDASPRSKDAALDAIEMIASMSSQSGNIERQSNFVEQLRSILS